MGAAATHAFIRIGQVHKSGANMILVLKWGSPKLGAFHSVQFHLNQPQNKHPATDHTHLLLNQGEHPFFSTQHGPFAAFVNLGVFGPNYHPKKKQNLTTEVQNNTNLFLQSGEHWPLERHNTNLLANTPCYHVLTELLWLLLGSLLKPNLNTHSSLPPFQPPAGLWVTKGLLKHIMHVRNSKSLT